MKHLPIKVVVVAAIAVVSFVLFRSAGTSGKILKIDFESPVIEHNDEGFSFDLTSLLVGPSKSMSLLSYVRAIDAAAVDPSIKAIYMTPGSINADLAQMEEIRSALERFRQTGKRIISYSEDLANATYYMASVADIVVLNPSAEVFPMGLCATQFFIKDLADHFGIKVQLIRHGKYKSAGEMFTRNDISLENRLQSEELYGSVWENITSQIALSRGFSTEQYNEWIDNLELISSEAVLERGLVDALFYKDQLEDSICRMYAVGDLSYVDYVGISKYASRLKKGSRKAKVAVVYATGDIVTDGSYDNVVSDDMVPLLRRLRKNKSVRSVVFRVSSPGGSVQASEMIKRELDLIKGVKPLVVSFGESAASGGYWISAGADKIFTDRNTLTGSIGCFSIIPDFSGMTRGKLHINPVSILTNRHSDMTMCLRKLDESETEYYQKQIEQIYDEFLTVVADGRGLKKQYVDSIAQGRIWSGNEALALGLADTEGGLIDAIVYAADVAGLTDYRIDEFPYVESGLARYLFSDTDIDENLLSSSQESVPMLDIRKIIPVLSIVERLDKPVNMARMPMIISVE